MYFEKKLTRNMVQFTIAAIDDGDQSVDNQPTNDDNAQMKRLSGTFTLEEAISETKIGKCQHILTCLTAIGILGNTTENINISYIMPYIKCDLKLTTEEQGLLSAISYLGIVCTSHFWGLLADTWGRQKVLQASAIGGFIFAFLSAFATNFISMILLRFATGAFVAGLASAGFSYVSEFHTSASAARAASYVSIALSGAWVVLSPVALLIIPMDWNFSLYSIEYKPWRFFLTCLSFINLFNAIAISFLPESPKFLIAMNRNDDAVRVLQRIYAFNTGNPKEEYPVKYIESVSLTANSLSDVKGLCGFFSLILKQTKPIFQPPLLSLTWRISSIIFVMFAIGHGIFMWFPDFLLQLLNYDGAPKTLCEIVVPNSAVNSTSEACNIDNKDLFPFQLLFAVGICFVLLAAMCSFFLKRINPKMLVCGWLCVSAVACLLLNILTEVYSSIMSFFIFLSVNCSTNILMAIAVNVFPTNYRGVATAFILMFGRIGGLSGSSIVGFMLNINCSYIFYISSGVIIVCALIFKTTNLQPH